MFPRQCERAGGGPVSSVEKILIVADLKVAERKVYLLLAFNFCLCDLIGSGDTRFVFRRDL